MLERGRGDPEGLYSPGLSDDLSQFIDFQNLLISRQNVWKDDGDPKVLFQQA